MYAYAADGNQMLAVERYNSLGTSADKILDEIMQDPSIDNALSSNSQRWLPLEQVFFQHQLLQ